VVRELPADLETPISVYLKLAGAGPSFLLESVTGGEQVARYSFIGVDSSQAYVLRGQSLERHGPEHTSTIALPDDVSPLDALHSELTQFHPQSTPSLPRFNGGLVGYLGYDTVRYFEPTLSLPSHPYLPDAIFLLADTVVAFDHAFGRMLLIANAHLNGNEASSRAEAEARLGALQERLSGPIPAPPARVPVLPATELSSDVTREQFIAAVRRAKEYITAGDIFQVVLS